MDRNVATHRPKLNNSKSQRAWVKSARGIKTAAMNAAMTSMSGAILRNMSNPLVPK